MDTDIENKLDYSPLHKLVNIRQLIISLFRPVKGSFPQYGVWVGLLLVACAVLLYYEARSGEYGNGAATHNMDVVVISCMALAAAAIKYVWSKVQSAKIRSFAKRNRIHLLEFVRDPEYEGVIFGQGFDRHINCAYVLPGHNGMEIGNYVYRVSVTGRKSTHRYGYVKLQLPRKLPHILLNSKLDDEIIESPLPVKYGAEQRIDLEGNFNEFYTVYAPREYHKDVFYIFTPDVMEALTKLPKPYNIEIIDNTLYLYLLGSFRLDIEHELRGIISTSDTIRSELTRQVKQYKDSNVTGACATDSVAPAGQRLVPARLQMPWYVLGAVLLLMGLSVYSIVSDLSAAGVFGLILLALTVIVVVRFAYSAIKRR